jgi:hypothetical protein
MTRPKCPVNCTAPVPGRNGRLDAQRFAANRRPRKARYDADFVQ